MSWHISSSQVTFFSPKLNDTQRNMTSANRKASYLTWLELNITYAWNNIMNQGNPVFESRKIKSCESSHDFKQTRVCPSQKSIHINNSAILPKNSLLVLLQKYDHPSGQYTFLGCRSQKKERSNHFIYIRELFQRAKSLTCFIIPEIRFHISNTNITSLLGDIFFIGQNLLA